MPGFAAHARTEVAAPPERVWAAMTDPDKIARYMMGSRQSMLDGLKKVAEAG